MNLKSGEVAIFTDGSSRGNPGPGGWGAVIVFYNNKSETRGEGEVQEIGGKEKYTTNNRMEIKAAIEALAFVSNFKFSILKKVQLFSDSSYLVSGITKWIHSWQKNNWETKAKQEVENRDLWEKLAEISINLEINWRLIGGHVGVSGNERCDEIATTFADNLKPNLYNGSLEKYSIKNILDIKFDGEKNTKQSEDRGRSRARAYSYISLADGVIKTHKTWAECEARVKGKPAKFKKALSTEEEKDIIKSFEAL